MEYSSDTESIPKVIRGKRTEDKEELQKKGSVHWKLNRFRRHRKIRTSDGAY